VRVVRYDFREVVVNLDTLRSMNDAEKYPRPRKHDDDTEHQSKVVDEMATGRLLGSVLI